MPTIRNRGGKFQVQVRLKKDGHIVHQESATFATRKQAELWGLSLENKLAREGVENRGAELTTFGDVIDKHEALLRSMGNGIRGSWGSLVYIRTAPFLHKPVGHIRVPDITQWVKSSSDGKAPATILHAMMTLRAAYRSAESMHGIPAKVEIVASAINQLARLKLVGSSQNRDRRVSDAELAKLHEVMRNRASRIPMATLVDLAVVLPRRLEELTTMLWEDYTGVEVLLRNTKTPDGTRDEVVPVPPDAAAIIDKLPRTDARILPYNAKSASNAFAIIAESAGLGDIHFHDLRHEGISRLFAAGLDIPEVALISGHRSWATLKRYTHLKPSDVLEKLKNGNRSETRGT